MKLNSLTQTASRWSVCFLIVMAMVASAAPVFAQDNSEPAAPTETVETPAGEMVHSTDFMVIFLWLVALSGALAALFFAWKFFSWVVAQDEGDEKMVYIAENVREGARAYLNRQYKVVSIFFVVTSITLTIFAYVFKAQSNWVPFAFVTGCLLYTSPSPRDRTRSRMPSSA